MSELEELRKRLDEIDSGIMRLFSERMEAAGSIGRIKRAAGLPVEDTEREAEVIASRTALLPEQLRESGERLCRLLMEESKRVQRREGNLYLIGMPDCGKTRMGRKLAAMLKMPLADTDKLIMDGFGMSIDEVFAKFGEEGFREAEAALLRVVAQKGGMIVAAGGGMPIWGSNAQVMKNSGFVVFLDRALEALHGQNTRNRPLIAAAEPEEVNARIDRLYRERRDKYAACADITLDPDEPGAAERAANAYEGYAAS